MIGEYAYAHVGDSCLRCLVDAQEATRKAAEAKAAAAEVARLKAEQEARDEAEALAYFERQQRVCPLDELRMVPNCKAKVFNICQITVACADTSQLRVSLSQGASRELQHLTPKQQELVQRHRDGDTPDVLKEDEKTNRLFFIQEYNDAENGCVLPEGAASAAPSMQ